MYTVILQVRGERERSHSLFDTVDFAVACPIVVLYDWGARHMLIERIVDVDVTNIFFSTDIWTRGTLMRLPEQLSH